MIQGLFGVELALFWRGDIWPFGDPGGSLGVTPGVSWDFYRYDRLLIGQCHSVNVAGLMPPQNWPQMRPCAPLLLDRQFLQPAT